MDNELISVIVPAYNAEAYIGQTVRSILAQTHPDIEIICVDDGSSDGTFAVLQSLAESDARVRVIHQENAGVTAARKNGILHSTGAYIGFVDADDSIDPTMYEKLLANMKQYHADISHCGHEVTYLDGSKRCFYGTGKLLRQNKTDGVRSLLAGEFEPGLCNKLYRRELMLQMIQNGEADDSVRINEDLLMNYHLFRSAETTVLEDVCLYRYIKREGSASAARLTESHIWDPITVKQRILADAEGTAYEPDARRAMLFTCVNQYNNLLKYAGADHADDAESIRALIRQNKKDAVYLKRKHAVGAKLIMYTPRLYRLLYRLFS